MGALDFLFEGKPPPSVTTYGSSTTDMPKWLSDYTQGLIGRANSIAAEPYQPYGGPRLAGLTPDQQNAFDITRQSSGSYIPGMQQAQQAAGSAVSSAQPYFNKAGQTYPEAVGQYMNPYVENVINRGSQLATRTLNESFLPGVANYFGASGSGPRSTQMRATVDRGVRDLTEGLNSQNQAALAEAYESGANTFGQDAARLSGLGSTIGNLNLAQAGTQAGLAETNQGLQLRDAAAQEAVGQAQQADTQKSLDLGYQDFQNQRDYPKNQTDWLASVIRGTPTPQTTNSASTGPASSMQASPIGQLGSLATGIAGIWNAFKPGTQKKRGGRVSGLEYIYA